MSHRKHSASYGAQKVISRRDFATLVAIAAGYSLLARARIAFADSSSSVSALIMVMHATQTDGGGSIDPSIGDMPQLKKPPFSAYNTYRLLDKKVLPLEKAKPATHGLITGRTVQVTLLDVTADHRFHIGAAINQPGGQAFLKLLEVNASANEPFFVAGQSYQGGTLVLGITIRP
jgi:hypothetical protein